MFSAVQEDPSSHPRRPHGVDSADRNLADRNLADRNLADRNLADRNLAEDPWSEFAGLGSPRLLDRGGLLFQEDDPSENVFVVCTGQLKLFCMSREGRVHIVRIAVPGDLLGLGAVIAGTHYEVSAKALMPTEVKSVPKQELLPFLERRPEACMYAVRSLAQEYKSAFFDARRLSLMPSASGRLGAVLLDLAGGGAHGATAVRFTMALTHEDLAGLAGLTRETVTRMLAKMQVADLIRIRGSSMTLLDPRKLADMRW